MTLESRAADHHISVQATWETSLPIEHATPLCTALRHCNLQRVERQLRDHDGTAVPPTVVHALFEALEYDLGRDAGVAAALTKALTALTESHDLQQGARYKGLLRLLAHPEPSVRSMV